MRLEIEKHLEEHNWVTPGDALKWIKENFTIDMHLSYQQTDDIVQGWRTKNNIYKEYYIHEHSTNKAGLPFFRSNVMLNYKKNNTNKTFKILIWGSDFQINRHRLTDHWYVDGTFTIVPSTYKQLVSIMIRDPNTGFIKPAMWIVLDCKDEEAYYHMFRMLKEITDSSGSLDWNLASATLDFEPGLMNGFVKAFPNATMIGCLFHFKQALFREAQLQGTPGDENKEATKTVVSQLGQLCWTDDELVDKRFEEIETKYTNTIFKNLVGYYKDNWLSRLKSGLIAYKDIDDDKRANSVIEKYNAHVKDSLPRSPTWPKFINFLVNEEAEYVTESFLAEQRGQTSVKSQNFGKTYLPKSLKQSKKLVKINRRVKVSTSKNKNLASDAESTLENEVSDTNSMSDNSTINGHNTIKGKRKNCPATHDSIDEETEKLPNKKLKPTNNAVTILESKTKDEKKVYVYNSKSWVRSQRSISPQNDIKDKVSLAFKSTWLKWAGNSCRYDCFCTIFSLCLFPTFECFSIDHADKRNRFYKHYIELYKTARLLLQNQELSSRQEIIRKCWGQMFDAGIDSIQPSQQGFVQQLLRLFQPLLILQPFTEEVKHCKSCGIEEKARIRWQIPMKVHDCNHLKYESLQRYFDWYMTPKHSHHCEVCLQEKVEIITTYKSEPSFIIIEFIAASEGDQFHYNDVLINPITKSKFELVAPINVPSRITSIVASKDLPLIQKHN